MDGADGTSDGVVTGGSVAGTDLTLQRSIGADIVIPGLPTGGGGGADDGVVDTAANLAVNSGDLTLTLGRSWGAR